MDALQQLSIYAINSMFV